MVTKADQEDEDIEKILRMGGRHMDRKREGATQWFLRTVKKLRSEEDPDQEDTKSLTGVLLGRDGELVGQMIAYSYDPKHKATLPYYDRYPLVIPLSVDGKGMLGLNLHYLPPKVRLQFIRALEEYAQEENGLKKLQISYSIVSSARGMGNYVPCIKRYLFPHLRSRVIRVDPREWENATLLPLARFVGADQATVWAESMSKTRSKNRGQQRAAKKRRR